MFGQYSIYKFRYCCSLDQLLPLAMAFVLLALVVPCLHAQPEVVVEPWSEGTQAATEAYWTREAIALAPALSWPLDLGTSEVDPPPIAEKADFGQEGHSPAGAAEPGSDAFHRAFYAQDWENLGEDWGALYQDAESAEPVSPAQKGTSQAYTSYDVNAKTLLWKEPPHRWMGRLTFTTPTGNASCSATAISNNHIVTAAHCVFDTPVRNAFWTNKIFTPAYRNGSAPYGTFATTQCTILTAYKNLSGS